MGVFADQPADVVKEKEGYDDPMPLMGYVLHWK